MIHYNYRCACCDKIVPCEKIAGHMFCTICVASYDSNEDLFRFVDKPRRPDHYKRLTYTNEPRVITRALVDRNQRRFLALLSTTYHRN